MPGSEKRGYGWASRSGECLASTSKSLSACSTATLARMPLAPMRQSMSLPESLTATTAGAVEGCGILVVARHEVDDGGSGQQPAEVVEMALVSAPARTSIRIGSHMATSPSSSWSTLVQIGLPVSRRNSTHAEVSTRSTGAARPHVVEIALLPRPTQPARRVKVEGLRGQGAQGEVHGRSLGRQLIPVHDGTACVLIDVDVGTSHTPTRRSPRRTTAARRPSGERPYRRQHDL